MEKKNIGKSIGATCATLLSLLLVVGCAGPKQYNRRTGKEIKQVKQPKREFIVPNQLRMYTWTEVVRKGVPDFRLFAVTRITEVIRVAEQEPILELEFKQSGVKTWFGIVRYKKKAYGLYGVKNVPKNTFELRNGITRIIHGVVPMKEGHYENFIPERMYVDVGLVRDGRPNGYFIAVKGEAKANLLMCRIDYLAGRTQNPSCADIKLEDLK